MKQVQSLFLFLNELSAGVRTRRFTLAERSCVGKTHTSEPAPGELRAPAIALHTQRCLESLRCLLFGLPVASFIPYR